MTDEQLLDTCKDYFWCRIHAGIEVSKLRIKWAKSSMKDLTIPMLRNVWELEISKEKAKIEAFFEMLEVDDD